MKSKYYFCKILDDERCYLKKDLIELAKEIGLCEVAIIPAKIMSGEDFAWCSEYMDVVEVRSGDCGKFCPAYKPRNGKNGRCRHSHNCYEPIGEEIILKIN